MNVDRRVTARVCIELIKECSEIGEMSDTAHVALTEALNTMQRQEYWQLRNQERHEGKNEPTDRQIAICRVAVPALETAVKALADDDYDLVIEQLTLAVETDGSKRARGKRERG